MKEPKLVEILISVSFQRRGTKLFQHFEYGHQHYVSRMFDSRFLLKQLFFEKLIEHSLTRDPECDYLERRDEEGQTILVYESTKKSLPESYYFKLVDFAPPFPGCQFCIHKRVDGEKIICAFKNNKVLKHELEHCQVFSQKRILKP
jgi:hypothetical protein